MMALKILRGIALFLVSCIMFSLISLIAISVYRFNQTRTEFFRPQSIVEFFQGPKFQGPKFQGNQTIIIPSNQQELQGQLPIGRWACFHVLDFEENRKTNKSAPITRCAINWRMFDSTIIELKENSVGHTLLLDQEKLNTNSFKLAHSSNFYLRGEELRWMFYANEDNFSLIIQTQAEYHTYLDIISNNLLHKFSREDEYLVRISSPEYILLMNYKDCIKANNTRNLYELQDCGIPWN